MNEYLSTAELHSLTGRPQHKRQVEWLRRYKWRFAVDDLGRPKVSRAYHDRRMVADDIGTPEPVRHPNFSAIGG